MLLLPPLRCTVPLRASMTDAAATTSPAQQRRTSPSQADLVQAATFKAPDCGIIDIGVNLTDKSYERECQDVINRAAAANVKGMIVTVHPHQAKTCDGHTLDALRKLAAHPQCVAIGECGLDFNRNFSPQDTQIEWFGHQVALAEELGKPLFMHCRDAGQQFAEVLRRRSGPSGPRCPAVIHCFTGSAQELREFLDLGLYIGITGWVCDERPERGGAELASLLPLIPPDRLMIETDAPYLTPRTITPSKARPGRNEPALLPHVLRRVAQATGRTEEEVARQTSEVASRVFGFALL